MGNIFGFLILILLLIFIGAMVSQDNTAIRKPVVSPEIQYTEPYFKEKKADTPFTWKDVEDKKQEALKLLDEAEMILDNDEDGITL